MQVLTDVVALAMQHESCEFLAHVGGSVTLEMMGISWWCGRYAVFEGGPVEPEPATNDSYAQYEEDWLYWVHQEQLRFLADADIARVLRIICDNHS